METSLALLLAIFGALLLAAGFLDDLAARVRVPGILLVLVLGLLTDNRLEAVPGQPPPLLTIIQADQLAQIALVLLLFFGGLTTNWHHIRLVLAPAARLASIGAGLTALLVAAVVWEIGTLPIGPGAMTVPLCLFIGAMVCSTDASAVMALLRPLADRLPQRLLNLIECESAFNDPMAVVLCGLALAMAAGHAKAGEGALVTQMARQFLLGGLLGFLGGSIAAQSLATMAGKDGARSRLVVMSLGALALLVGATQLLGGSGILAAYVAGVVLGNSPQLDQDVLEDTHAGFAKMAELLLFLCLGLVVQPEQVVQAMGWALVLFAAMLLVRWLMVEVLLWRSPFVRAERLLISVAGLRGAVPIAMALQAAAEAEHVSWGAQMPALALAVVLLGLLLQGLALAPMARRLGLASPG